MYLIQVCCLLIQIKLSFTSHTTPVYIPPTPPNPCIPGEETRLQDMQFTSSSNIAYMSSYRPNQIPNEDPVFPWVLSGDSIILGNDVTYNDYVFLHPASNPSGTTVRYNINGNSRFTGVIGLVGDTSASFPNVCNEAQLAPDDDGDSFFEFYVDNVLVHRSIHLNSLREYEYINIDVSGGTELKIVTESYGEWYCDFDAIALPRFQCTPDLCETAGWDDLRLQHKCQCQDKCSYNAGEEFCNRMELVVSRLGDDIGDAPLCNDASDVCCCSCENCDGYHPISVGDPVAL